MKIEKIMLLFLINLWMITNYGIAKYVYSFEETIIEFSRDTNPPICHISYSANELTNQNVTVTIKTNKEIEPVSGFLLSEDKKVLTKEVSQNEQQEIFIRDLSGNYTKTEYSVDNIDKEPPQIIGIENGGIYVAPVSLDFLDNHGIENIKVDRYSYKMTIVGFRDLENPLNLIVRIDEHPLGSSKYRYYIDDKLYATVTGLEYMFVNLNENAQIRVEALDGFGNVLESCLLEKIVEEYVKEEVNVEENRLTQSGNYQVIVSDTAGNLTVYYIKIQ